jgi:hypothetical protein
MRDTATGEELALFDADSSPPTKQERLQVPCSVVRHDLFDMHCKAVTPVLQIRVLCCGMIDQNRQILSTIKKGGDVDTARCEIQRIVELSRVAETRWLPQYRPPSNNLSGAGLQFAAFNVEKELAGYPGCRSALHNLLDVCQQAISSVRPFLRSENPAFYDGRRFVGKSADMVVDDRSFKGQRGLYESAKAE